MRLSDATTHFTRQLAANACSIHTQKAYARDLRAFARWTKIPESGLGRDAALSAIKPDDLARLLISDAVLRTPDGQSRKPITINRTKAGPALVLRLLRGVGVDQGESCPADPVGTSGGQGAVDADRGRNSEAEGRCCRSTTPFAARDRLILELLLGTGIRSTLCFAFT